MTAPETKSRSVVVVGGGIFGVTGALELRRRGWNVTLLDPGPIPHPLASSTDISKVIRMDYGADDFYTDLMEESLRRWDAWNRQWGEKLYHEDGFLIMSSRRMEPDGFEYESFVRINPRGYRLERIDSDQLRRRFHAWNAGHYRDGYLNPRAGWAESGAVVARVARDAIAAGVQIIEGKKFGELIETDSRIAGVETRDGEKYMAEVVVAAAGAWTPILLPHLSHLMWPVGQPVIHMHAENPKLFQPPQFACWAADIASTGWYGFPALDDGTFKIGNHGPGYKIHPDDPLEVPAEHEGKTRDFLKLTFPSLANAPVKKTRLCLYCDTWDGNFYIDHDPQRPGLFIAAGGSGHAFKFAPMFGDLIADGVERKSNPYAHRFAWRKRGEAAKEDARFL
ncbi:FAD-dependent oxidoreductase [Candidatus Sumerlaeota bacterium]|nr:FAD-dependent oxidoreductase [Candidatus Sumerlaeota bacterium]